MVGGGDVGEEVGLQEVLEDIAGEMLAYPMVHVHECDASVGSLHLVVFDIGGDEDICALCDGFFCELCACSSAERNGLHLGVEGTGVAQVWGLESGLHHAEEGFERHGCGEFAYDTETTLYWTIWPLRI